MKNAIILHGGPSKEEYYDPDAPSMSNAHWIPWIQAQLLKHDIAAATPEVPKSYDRVWDVWVREVERFEITPETILIGHSTGAGFFVKYLSIRKNIRAGKVVLVAPWLDPHKTLQTHFFDDFAIDPGLVLRTGGITIFHSDNDEESVNQSVDILRSTIKDIAYCRFPGYGHFCLGDMNTPKFPELLEELLK